MLDLVRTILQRVLKLHGGMPEAPVGEHPEMFRASSKHLTYLLALWALRTGVTGMALLVPLAVAAVALAQRQDMPGLAIALVVVFVVLFGAFAFVGYASIRLDWEMRWYVLTDRSLRIREGIVLMREVTLTLANVQELKVSQGPIQRALGITDLIVDTAGGGAAAGAKGSIDSHHGVLRGVENGSDLRSRIESRVKQRRGAGLGDPDDHPGHPPGHALHALGAAVANDAFLAALRELRDEVKQLRGAARP